MLKAIEAIKLDKEAFKKITHAYLGFEEKTSFKRIAIFTHSGPIMEILNNVRRRKNLDLKFENSAKPTGIYVLRVYCQQCFEVCEAKEKCKMVFDFVLYNDVSHLGDIVDNSKDSKKASISTNNDFSKAFEKKKNDIKN